MTIVQLFSTKNFVLSKIKRSLSNSNNASDEVSSRFFKPRETSSSNCTIVRYTATFDIRVSIHFGNLRSFFIAKLTKASWEACVLCVWICNWVYKSRVYSLDSTSLFDYFRLMIHDFSTFRFARFIVYVQS